jgi:hypothetical protein
MLTISSHSNDLYGVRSEQLFCIIASKRDKTIGHNQYYVILCDVHMMRAKNVKRRKWTSNTKWGMWDRRTKYSMSSPILFITTGQQMAHRIQNLRTIMRSSVSISTILMSLLEQPSHEISRCSIAKSDDCNCLQAICRLCALATKALMQKKFHGTVPFSIWLPAPIV